MTFKIGSRKPQTNAEKKAYFDYWNDLLPQDTDFISRAIPLAQIAHESAWSTSELAKNAHNHAGHKFKGDDGWDKTRQYIKDAKEHDDDGSTYIVPDTGWRKYHSDKEFAEHHARWLSRTAGYAKRYAKTLSAKTWQEQLKALQGTYASDTRYYSKTKAYIDDYDLTQYDKKESTNMAKLRTPIKRHTQVNMGGTINKIEYLVIHFVGASGQALANANYFYNVLRNASAHRFIDSQVTYEVVPVNRVAWHVGDGASANAAKAKTNGYYHAGGATNNNSLGIEGCQDTSTGSNVWQWQFHANTYEQMLLQTSAWMDEFRVPIEKVVRHFDVSGKSCPGNWMANEWLKWHKFKTDLAELRKTGAVKVDGSTESNRYNPKGFQEVAIAEYREPTKPFKTLFTNSDATPREVFNWYNPETKRYMISPNAPKYAGVKDKVEQIMDVNIGYSKKAYLLKNAKTWILEQDLKEPRADWESGLTASTYVVVKGDYLFKIAEQFNTTVEDLKKWNKLESNLIFTGMELFVVEPYDYLPEDEKPTSTDDSDNEAKDEVVEDKGAETPAVELAENEVMDAKGNIFIRSEGWVLTPKE